MKKKQTNSEPKKKNAVAEFRTVHDPKYGVVFQPRKWTTQAWYALCVPGLGCPLSGLENGPFLGHQVFDSNTIEAESRTMLELKLK